MALTEDGKIITTEQFRPGPNAVLNELPGGYVDDGETREEAVRRELLKETKKSRQNGGKLAAFSGLARVEGFEPPNAGTKTQCLTTWRHPNKTAPVDLEPPFGFEPKTCCLQNSCSNQLS